MGTGVGEAMLIGAVTGAGTSAITGGDPLKGALLGAAGGGLGAGAAGATSGAASGTTAGATSGAASGTTAGATSGATAGTAGLQPLAQTPSAVLDPALSGTAGVPGGQGVSAGLKPQSDNLLSRFLGGESGASIPTPNIDDAREGSKYFPNIAELYAKNPNLFPAVAGASANLLFNSFEDEEKEKERYGGPLSQFSYSPDRYTSYAASGGLMDTAPARRLMGGGQLGSYSDGGQTLQGPGDGMSDSIPASIGGAQPARLADGEFVVPADVVSGIGNGSTDAGARQLYDMMDKIREARTGRTEQAPEINPRRMMPA